jgi:hypothetical protein
MLGYKYRAINKYSLDILKNNSIHFSKYTDFNDPFEFCTPFPNLGEMYKRAAKEINELHENKIFSKENHAALISRCENIIKNRTKSLDQIHKKIKEGLEKTGIYSLSKVNDEILMWSHYADNHKGFCIGFENLHKHTHPNTKPFLVSYKNDFTDLSDPKMIVDYYKEVYHDNINLPTLQWKNKQEALAKKLRHDDDQRGGISILTDKYEKWSYEQEFRLIDEKNNGLKKFNPECIKSITFGLRTSEIDIDAIIKICKESNKTDIEYYRTVKAKQAFKLEIKPHLK